MLWNLKINFRKRLKLQNGCLIDWSADHRRITDGSQTGQQAVELESRLVKSRNDRNPLPWRPQTDDVCKANNQLGRGRGNI